jgi:hypothetical protein
MRNRYLTILTIMLFGNLALAEHRFSFTEFRQENRIEDQKKEIMKPLKHTTCDNRKKDQECCTPSSKTSVEQKRFVELNC